MRNSFVICYVLSTNKIVRSFEFGVRQICTVEGLFVAPQSFILLIELSYLTERSLSIFHPISYYRYFCSLRRFQNRKNMFYSWYFVNIPNVETTEKSRVNNNNSNYNNNKNNTTNCSKTSSRY